jgi:hypothetical protein
MRGIGQQGAENVNPLGVCRRQCRHDPSAELPPAKIRLQSVHEHEIPAVRQFRDLDLSGRPDQLTFTVSAPYMGAVDLVVVEVVGIQRKGQLGPVGSR